jgi:hypothetical protein
LCPAPRGGASPDGRPLRAVEPARGPGWGGVVSGAEEPVQLAVHDLGHLLWLPLSRIQPTTIGILMTQAYRGSPGFSGIGVFPVSGANRVM